MTDNPVIDVLSPPLELRRSDPADQRFSPEAWLQPGVSEQSGERRRFLFVTAPFGPFSRQLAARLRQSGAACSRILLNGGDLLDWGPNEATPYRGGAADWPAWIERHLAGRRISDIITHGDSHPYAVAAIRIARVLGLRVHVFEEGYLRPNWITLERDGVNARSRLSRHPQHYVENARGRRREAVPMGRITPGAVYNISRYHFWAFLLAPAFPQYASPYVYPPRRQALGHIGRYIRQKARRRQAANELRAIVSKPGPLFLALLQRPGDSQLICHSRLGGCDEFIRLAVGSFAAHAPADARLLVKSHPLDHGLEAHAEAVAEAVRRHGADGRVFFADDGHFPTLLRRCDGVLSVNSTGGLAGLEMGKPTLALGEALYDIEGLTHKGGIDTFWSAPQKPDPELYDAFSEVLAEHTQINGAFSTRKGVELAVSGAARRLLAAL